MSKQDLILKLTEMGYEAQLIDGIPYILNASYSKADKIIKELGYKRSYGVKIIK